MIRKPRSVNERAAVAFALPLVRDVCWFAGAGSLIRDAEEILDAQGVTRAIADHDDRKLFEWFMQAVNYQGVADAVAFSYLKHHGRTRAKPVMAGLIKPPCPKLASFWDFTGCHYSKTNRSCAEPAIYQRCTLPTHDMRNGKLNQTAYSLALFFRDIADGDFVRWLDRRLAEADQRQDRYRPQRLARAVLEPMLGIYGVSYKVLAMSLSELLLAGDRHRERWTVAGSAMIAIDTLVHNWMHRSGILKAFDAVHPYGPRCMSDHGCAAIIAKLALRIDAGKFNPAFPRAFPRFVQHAIWRFCAQSGLDQCNGNQIDDTKRCALRDCAVFSGCRRIALTPAKAS